MKTTLNNTRIHARGRLRRAALVAALVLPATLVSGCGVAVDLTRSHDDHRVWEPAEAEEAAPKSVQSVAEAACREALEREGTRSGAEYVVDKVEFDEDFRRYELVSYAERSTGNPFWPDYETVRSPVMTTRPRWAADATYTLQPTGSPAREQMEPTTRTQACLYEQTDADEPTSVQWGLSEAPSG